MGRKSKAKFELKGHALPGINQRSETANAEDGRSPSSAFQMKEDSPLQQGWLGKAANVMTGGLAGGIGKAMKGDWKGAGKSMLTGGLSSLGDSGGGAGAALKDEVKAELKDEIAQG